MDIFHSYEFLRSILDFILPRTCIICETVLFQDEALLCEKCSGDIPHTYFWLLRNNPMSDKFNSLIQEDLIEAWNEHAGVMEKGVTAPGRGSATLGMGERYAYAAALFFYRSESEYRKITQVIKYHGRSDVGRTFGRMLGERLRYSFQFADIDAIIPVPLHWMRQWQRGYNQAEIIAYGVAEVMGIPVRCDILKRSRRTKTQTRLGIDEKAANVKGAFVVDERWLKFLADRSHLSSDDTGTTFRHLLLIDDVYTTGSTLHACFLALRTVFPPPIRISIATLGFVGDI